MKRILLRVAAAWAIITAVTLVPLGLYCVWTPGYLDEEPDQYRIVLSWLWAGVVPSIILFLAYACMYGPV